MNEIIKSLYDRKSVRVYEDRPIPEKMKQIILEAAAQAPSAGCQQLYTILDITDQKLKDELVKTCDNQPFIATAPMVLVFCADCKKWYDAYLEAGCSPRKPGVGDLMLAVTDTAIAAQNAVVAAQSFGHGFEGPGPENAVAPDGHGPRCGLVGSTREQGSGNEDSIGRAVSCHGTSPSEGERRSGRPTREGQPGFQMQYTS